MNFFGAAGVFERQDAAGGAPKNSRAIVASMIARKKKRKKSRMKPLQIPAMTVQYRRLALTVTENFRKQ